MHLFLVENVALWICENLNNLKEIETKFLREEKHQNDKKVRMCN